ncbi:MAG: peptidoglycan-binding domain-containing protein [Candidatus Omnitrophota bacterium]
MLRKIGIFLSAAGILLLASGCATIQKKNELEKQGLRNQVSVLEAQLQQKEQMIKELEAELSGRIVQETLRELPETKYDMPAGKASTGKTKPAEEIKWRPTVRQVQIALRNAGYNYVMVDRHMGKLTRKAIRAFQQKNSLFVSGKVDRLTWNLLKNYLYSYR